MDARWCGISRREQYYLSVRARNRRELCGRSPSMEMVCFTSDALCHKFHDGNCRATSFSALAVATSSPY